MLGRNLLHYCHCLVILFFRSLVGFLILNLFAFRTVLTSTFLALFGYFRKHHGWWIAPILVAILSGGMEAIYLFLIACYSCIDSFRMASWMKKTAIVCRVLLYQHTRLGESTKNSLSHERI